MTLEEYREVLGTFETVPRTAEGTHILAGQCASQIACALWQPHARREATQLLAEFNRIRSSIEHLTYRVTDLWISDEAKTLSEWLASRHLFA